MSDEDKSLSEKLEEGDYTIEVMETLRRGKKLALDKQGERTLSQSENEALKEYMDKYEELIFEISEAAEKNDGFDRAWELGRLMIEASEEANEKGEDFSFNHIVPAISEFNFSSSTAYRCRLLYRMFPEKGYDDEVLPHTTTAEIMQAADDAEEAREVYDRISDAGLDPSEPQIRAWGASEPNLESIVPAVNEKCGNNLVENSLTVSKLHGVDPEPRETEIKQVVDG